VLVSVPSPVQALQGRRFHIGPGASAAWYSLAIGACRQTGGVKGLAGFDGKKGHVVEQRQRVPEMSFWAFSCLRGYICALALGRHYIFISVPIQRSPSAAVNPDSVEIQNILDYAASQSHRRVLTK
jgi:hypothetical protein